MFHYIYLLILFYFPIKLPLVFVSKSTIRARVQHWGGKYTAVKAAKVGVGEKNVTGKKQKKRRLPIVLICVPNCVKCFIKRSEEWDGVVETPLAMVSEGSMLLFFIDFVHSV